MTDSRLCEPDIIKKLDEATINRIAAGEIIIRPANAIKEMLENSLDAKSSNIQISAKFGGLKYLQIQDNGTGIRKDDLSIICERFTTSKLKKFEDLTTIGTFGFRGEALCSISHVAHLTIQTKTASEKCAYKAMYSDGQLKGPAKPCAGNQGTQITAEDMFYNMPQRKNTFKSPTDEFNRIYDVVSKYAIHNPHVAFSLNKIGDKMVMRTPANSTIDNNIEIIYGKEIAKHLKPIELTDKMLQFQMNGLYTNVLYSSKKQIFLFFINNRLVESKNLKQAIEAAFETYLQRGSHPFVYLNLQMESTNIDVNIHPTKHEVKFLHEQDIMDHIKKAFEKELASNVEARKLYVQQLMPGASDPSQSFSDDDENKSQKVYDRYLVRSDFKEQKLELFYGSSFTKSVKIEKIEKQSSTDQSSSIDKDEHGASIDDSKLNLSQKMSEQSSGECNDSDVLMSSQSTEHTNTIWFGSQEIAINASLNETIHSVSCHHPFRVTKRENETTLTSILTLRKRIEDKCQLSLRKILSDSVFVGAIDRELALIQSDKNLYLCNLHKLSDELIYQTILYDFGHFDRIALEPSLSVKTLALIALNTDDSGWTPDDGSKDELAERVSEILIEKAAMLREYFAIDITDDGHLQSLPALLNSYTPPICQVPIYILRIASEVDWEDEKRCFQTMARETAALYAHIPSYLDRNRWKWIVEHVMYAGVKQYLLPPDKFREMILQIANLSHLYRVFERC